MPTIMHFHTHPKTMRLDERGISLIELMVTITIGMLLVAGALALFSTTMGFNTNQVRISKLDNDLRHAMRQITADIRRADFRQWAPNQIGFDNVTPQSSTTPSIECTDCDLISISNPCADAGNDAVITVRYQLYSSDPTIQTFGYRRSGEQVQSGVNTSGGSISAWSSLTDNNSVEISHFSIQEHAGPSACFETDTAGTWARASYPMFVITIAGKARGASDICRSIQETVRMRNAIIQFDPTCTPT